LNDTFNTGAVTATTTTRTTVEPLYAYADNSASVLISNSVYLDAMKQDALGATWYDVDGIDSSTMGSTTVLPTALSGTYFTPGNPNPTLIWQSASLVGPIYVDPNAATGGTGTIASPFNNLASAATVQSVSRSAIYVLGTLPVTTTVSLNDSADVERVIRGVGFVGNLIEVDANGAVTVAGGYVDGNTAVTGITGSLFYVNGGTLTLTAGTLQNNITSGNGGAVSIASGSATLSGGAITANTAANVGGVYIASGGSFTTTAGAISGNTATGLGAGVYDAGTFTITPTSGATFSLVDVIYLPSEQNINLGADLTSNITVATEGDATVSEVLVAVASTDAMATASVTYFQYDGSGVAFVTEDTDIYAYLRISGSQIKRQRDTCTTYGGWGYSLKCTRCQGQFSNSKK
jgi:hypothetical protein